MLKIKDHLNLDLLVVNYNFKENKNSYYYDIKSLESANGDEYEHVYLEVNKKSRELTLNINVEKRVDDEWHELHDVELGYSDIISCSVLYSLIKNDLIEEYTL